MRLIDADALCKKIRDEYDGYMLDEGCCPIEFENMVDDQPTAYNVDAVVEQLEEESDYEPIDYDYCDVACTDEQHFIATDKAIEIVRKGGAE